MTNFHFMEPESLDQNTFELIGRDWMLIAAQKEGKANAMTASWGGLGFLWGKNVAYTFIRQERFTKQFVDSSDRFSLCFFDTRQNGVRKMLNYMGSVSGRNEDKIQTAGLTLLHEEGVPYFAEANMVLLCRKLYAQNFLPECFIAQELKQKWYCHDSYHTFYISAIEKILAKNAL